MDAKKFLDFINKFNVDRQANHIFVQCRETKKIEKFFHAGTSDQAEEMLQAWIKQICS